jgi:hypothetical protein
VIYTCCHIPRLQAFGVTNNVQSPGYGFDFIVNATQPGPIVPATLLSRTINVRNANGTIRTDALRVNGAAVKARCQ